MKLATLLVAVSISLSSTAFADEAEDEQRDEENFLPIGFFPQVGAGFVARAGGEADFDGTIRWSPSKRVAPRTYAGAFLEMHTISFDTYDFAIGPQMQYRIGKDFAVQARAGVGSQMEGEQFAVAGVQIGNFLVGATLTGRHYFDDDRTEISINAELNAVVALIPVWLAAI